MRACASGSSRLRRHEHADAPHPLGCCARAASGHAAAPPSSVMNSRRSHSITSSARASSDRRHVEAEHPGGLVVDDQLELGRLHDRQVRGLGALEDAAGIDADLTHTRPQCWFRSSSARRLRHSRARE